MSNKPTCPPLISVCMPVYYVERYAAEAVAMMAEDLDLWLRMGEHSRLANLPDVITRYRIHESSLTASLHDRVLASLQTAVDEACDCRGIPRWKLDRKPWRAVDRQSNHQSTLGYGWAGFCRGDRPAAVHFGLRAVKLMPWRKESWLLLACAILKMRSAKGEVSRPSPP